MEYTSIPAKIICVTDQFVVVKIRYLFKIQWYAKSEFTTFTPRRGLAILLITKPHEKRCFVPLTKTFKQSFLEEAKDRCHVVHKILYIILATCLGGFGVHKFYAGYQEIGILYLLLSWTMIPFVAALIDAVKAFVINSQDGYITV